MKAIDFSCKHDIMIKNEDGTYNRMDEPYFKAESIDENTWKILSDGDYSYLVAGTEEAVVIDSGYGCGNIREFAQSLTNVPVKNIFNTHDHFDHTANNCYFDCAYMSEETKKFATIPFPSFEGIVFPRDYPIRVIDEGFVYDLGERKLETFKIPDHAVGSLAFLDSKHRILFCGDEITAPVHTINGSVKRYFEYLDKLIKHRNEFDLICTGGGLLDGTIVDNLYNNVQYILEGHEGDACPAFQYPTQLDNMGDEKLVVFERRCPRLCDMPLERMASNSKFKKKMDYSGVSIIYDPRNI